MKQIKYPESLPKRRGGRALTVIEIQKRWRKIAEFYELNGVLPKHIDLEQLWQVSAPTVRHTLSIMGDRGMITYADGTSASFGISPENYRAAGVRYPMKISKLTMSVIMLASAGKPDVSGAVRAITSQIGFPPDCAELIITGWSYDEEIERLVTGADWAKCSFTRPFSTEGDEINFAVNMAQGNIIVFIRPFVAFERDLALSFIHALHLAWWDARPVVLPAHRKNKGHTIIIGEQFEYPTLVGLSMQISDFLAAGGIDNKTGETGLFISLEEIGCTLVTLPFITWEEI